MRLAPLRNPALVLLLAGCAAAAYASVPELEEGVEFRFEGTPGAHWRATRTTLDRRVRAGEPWLALQPAIGSRQLWGSDRVLLVRRDGAGVPVERLAGTGLTPAREVRPGIWIFQAADVWAAARAADRLAASGEFTVAAPVTGRPLRLHGQYAARPDDPYFTRQWHLENRDTNGVPLGPDLNPRSAWAITRGEGITVGVCDTGFETNHPDLRLAAQGGPHFDFFLNRAVASAYNPHATCVAGLIGATADNGVGATGIAPGARLADLSLMNRLGDLISEERLLDMYQYRNDEIQVQNHSWGNNLDDTLAPPAPLERLGYSNAVATGRGGRGVILVRAAGNERADDYNANYEGTANDPRVIAVAAVRRDGRAASYSTPGACVLVGAPSGDDGGTTDPGGVNLFTTDQVGRNGYNTSSSGDLSNYAYDSTGFSGTSGSSPLIAGVAALMLSVNTNLTWRDVQQILILAARQPDPTDPHLHRNGAGFRVSDNQGFGVPDAGVAVRLAGKWSNRPPEVTVSITTNVTLEVPDGGLQVRVTGTDGQAAGLPMMAALGPHPDDPTAELPLVNAGLATAPLTTDLTGRIALIQRGTSTFHDKITYAAAAGAAAVVIYNNEGATEIFPPAGTDYVPIPAGMIGEDDGNALATRLAKGETVRASLRLDAVRQDFVVTNTLLCEHVGLRVRATHDERGDLRITLVSPSGTRSVLQRLNNDIEPGPENWTYWSVQHFGESSAGTWTAWFSDEYAELTGTIDEVELILRGVEIEDADRDGLDDRWERRWFGSLDARPEADPDADGSSNAREQLAGTDPRTPDRERSIQVDEYEPGRRLRLSWPGVEGADYRLMESGALGEPATEWRQIWGRYPETDWVVPLEHTTNRVFWVERR